MPSDGCDHETCYIDGDSGGYDPLGHGVFELNKVRKELDDILRPICISQGEACSANTKFRLFGIPSTIEQKDTLIRAEASRLCHDEGSCNVRKVGIMLNVMTLGLGNGLTAISLSFDIGMSAFQGDPQGVAQEVGFEMLEEIEKEAMGTPSGRIIPVIDLGMDIKGLSEAEQAWVETAIDNVNVNIAQAETEFYNAWLAQLPGPVNTISQSNSWIPSLPFFNNN